jgi:hypothetical protein
MWLMALQKLSKKFRGELAIIIASYISFLSSIKMKNTTNNYSNEIMVY